MAKVIRSSAEPAGLVVPPDLASPYLTHGIAPVEVHDGRAGKKHRDETQGDQPDSLLETLGHSERRLWAVDRGAS